ncbi:hypothetical protein [Cesiribacter sp. SM1]|uniref:hypothetical protein n=1 Tax=Cesiribacter sp. SM1 TaxID=2861196 RepID=UPI001CD7BB08|nr:hypothetical protein [Cesiribacter sp. SM1]
MNRSKKLFLLITIIFLLLLAFVVWDFSRKTEFRRPRPEQPREEPKSVQHRP